jgi:large subunit ribosomal protein L9
LAENLRQRSHKSAKIRGDAQTIAAKLNGINLTIGAKASSTGTIFGSVNSIQVAEALAKNGFDIDRKLIVIKEAIKEIGNHTAVVKLHKEVQVTVNVNVVPE